LTPWLGGSTLLLRGLALGAWSLYALVSALRLTTLAVPSSIGFRLRALFWFLGLLPAIDLAKMIGYGTGLFDLVRGTR
jgi:hypothetical protein